ncbi:hypothetical protein MAR_015355 [Mya arenaria]|uniref:Uncharacterized protein n=1 Tax=Mya arenaria TaxID=6604 RepID=A0ABY7FKW7_MYAAR|nr:hypothetical protein MAR_015355 [Mya arenaria]
MLPNAKMSKHKLLDDTYSEYENLSTQPNEQKKVFPDLNREDSWSRSDFQPWIVTIMKISEVLMDLPERNVEEGTVVPTKKYHRDVAKAHLGEAHLSKADLQEADLHPTYELYDIRGGNS